MQEYFHMHVQGTGLLLEVERVELLFSCSQLASRLQMDLRILPITLLLPSPGSSGALEPAVVGGSCVAAALGGCAAGAHAHDGVGLTSREPSLAGAAASPEQPLAQVTEFSIATTLQLIGCALLSGDCSGHVCW